MTHALFPDDHRCELIRGLRVPSSGRIRKVLRERLAYLEHKTAERLAHRQAVHYFTEELAVLVVLLEREELAAAAAELAAD